MQEGLKRYFPSVYAPQLGVNFTWTSVSSFSQSLGEGGIFVGSADFEVEDMVTLKGVLAQSLNDFIVNCRNFTLEGERLHSESSQRTTNLNFTVSAKGDPYQVGISHSESRSASDVQAGATLQVGGKLVVNADTMIVDGSTIDTKQIAGNVKTLNIISRQDEAHCSSQAICVSSGGDFCVSEQRAESRVVNNPAGIHVQDSINGSDREFVVGTLNSTGGKITSDGINNFIADKVNAKDVEDYQKTSGFSACGNVKDFKQDTQTNHLLPPDRQSAVITTTNLNFSNSDYAAKNHTVIHGAGGTHLDVKETSGKVITNKSDGKEVTKDSSHSYNVVIPHMTKETKVQFRKNGKWAAEMVGRGERKVSDFFAPPRQQKAFNEEQDFGKPSHARPSHRANSNGDKWMQYGKHSGGIDSNAGENVPLSAKEAYQLGKRVGIGDVPDCVKDWPEDIKAQFNIGMREGQANFYGSAAGAIVAGAIALGVEISVGLVVLGERLIPGLAKSVTIGGRAYGFFNEVKNLSHNPEINKLIEMFEEYLGEGFKVMKPKEPGKSDLILMSADGTKKIRFDIINSHGQEPHINFETFKLRNAYPGDDKLARIENIHFYPRNDFKLEETIFPKITP